MLISKPVKPPKDDAADVDHGYSCAVCDWTTAWITVLKAGLMQHNVVSGMSRGAAFGLEGCLG